MSEDRGDWMYGKWLDAIQQFDYFATGVCLAMLGYVATHLPPHPFYGLAGMLAIGAVVLLVGAVVCGVKRSEAMILFVRYTGQRVHLEDMNKGIHAATERTGFAMELLSGMTSHRNDLKSVVGTNAQKIAKLKELERGAANEAEGLYRMRAVLFVIALLATVFSQGIVASFPSSREHETAAPLPRGGGPVSAEDAN